MKKLIAILFVLMAPGLAQAAGGKVHLDEANIDLNNQGALQRGAKYFMNYCFGCHAASYHRYNRMARDLGLTEVQLQENLMFTADFTKNPEGDPAKVGSLMKSAMPAGDSKEWFGNPPPDLTLVARVRGVDWLYTYLRTFYVDESRPFGVNNTTFPNVGMPHVLWELQGWQEPVYKYAVMEHGHAVAEFDTADGAQRYAEQHSGEHDGEKLTVSKILSELNLKESGAKTPEEYDQVVRDIVTFLAYLGEPIQQERKALGVWVLLFLFVLFVVSYYLKKEYWKDIH